MKVKNIVRSAQQGHAKVAALVTAASLATFSFMAVAGAPAAPSIGDTVAALVNEYKDEVLIAIFAYIVVKWTLKATGVLTPK